jgi:hypothetical protein
MPGNAPVPFTRGLQVVLRIASQGERALNQEWTNWCDRAAVPAAAAQFEEPVAWRDRTIPFKRPLYGVR